MAGNNTDTKAYYKSRTLWFNLAVALLAVLDTYSSLLHSYLPDFLYVALLLLIAAGNTYLRTVTTQGLSKK